MASKLRPQRTCARVGSTVCVFVALIGMCFAAPASARTRCSYSGAPENLLTVTADRGALTQITRRGQRIIATEFLARPERCVGGVPTVLNTDTIRITTRTYDDFVELRLAGGAFAPGATPESEGASEIEIEISGPEAFAYAIGTKHAEEFHWGPGVGPHAGLNLNPGQAGDQDVDVTVSGKDAALVAEGGAGNDTIVPAAGALFRNDGVFTKGGAGDDRLVAPRNSGGILDGGGGNDVLIGGSQLNDLIGGPGNDHMTGGRGPDRIDMFDGGSGRDVIFAGPGRDRINARDSHRDRVGCGAGRDRVKADSRDLLRGCEAVRR
jgi:Ca2+-binding RTX toxin-like protein